MYSFCCVFNLLYTLSNIETRWLTSFAVVEAIQLPKSQLIETALYTNMSSEMQKVVVALYLEKYCSPSVNFATAVLHVTKFV